MSLIRLQNVTKTYDSGPVLRDVYFRLASGDRIGLVGKNGAGMTTLLHVLVGDEVPDSGKIVWPKNTSYAHYNQILADLDLNDTVTHAVNAFGGHSGLAFHAPRRKINRFLGLMQFSEMDLNQEIGTLSAGQRARGALAQSLLSGASVLLLDEPTNHLDITTTQVMERTLTHFPGAIIVVSHDRFFIDRIATRLLVFKGEGVVCEVAGNWTIWQAGFGQAE